MNRALELALLAALRVTYWLLAALALYFVVAGAAAAFHWCL